MVFRAATWRNRRPCDCSANRKESFHLCDPWSLNGFASMKAEKRGTMDHDQLIGAVQQGRIEWSAHALRRMLERGISRESVKHALCTGEVIEDYPDDAPFPSALYMGIFQAQPLHVVAAYNGHSKKMFIITAYWPDEVHFSPDFKTRRQ